MADNIAITPGTGASVRTVDRAGVETQVVGLDIGTATESLVSSANPLPVVGKAGPLPAATATPTSVASTVTANTVLLAANAARLSALFFNDSAAMLYLALGATAGPTGTPTTFTVKIAPGGYYEMPGTGVIYTGVVTGVWAQANGAVRVTELTA